MSTINYTKILVSQKREYVTLSRSQYLEAQQQFYPKKRRDADIVAAELRAQRRDYRSNVCGSCFATKSTSGSCNCD